MCSPLEQAGKERERIKEREKGKPYTRIPDKRDVLREGQLQSLLEEVERLKGGSGSKGKGVNRGKSPLLLRKGISSP